MATRVCRSASRTRTCSHRLASASGGITTRDTALSTGLIATMAIGDGDSEASCPTRVAIPSVNRVSIVSTSDVARLMVSPSGVRS